MNNGKYMTLIKKYDTLSELSEVQINHIINVMKEVEKNTKEEIKNNMPTIEEGKENANRHFETEYDELENKHKHEYLGLKWGWKDCIQSMQRLLEI